jgi:hypothetical protein
MADVINIQDRMENNDEGSSTQPETQTIELGEVDGQELVKAITSGDFSNLDLDEYGLTEEDAKAMEIQMQQYQEESKRKQGYEILGHVFGIIQENNPEVLKIVENNGVYEELNNFMIATVLDIMDVSMKKTYDKMVAAITGILKREKDNPLVNPEDRMENRFGKIHTEVYDDEIPGTEYISMDSKILASLGENRTIDDRLVSYRLLEFIINSVDMETALLDEETRQKLLDQLSDVPKVLDSIGIKKIAKYVTEERYYGLYIDKNLQQYIKGIFNSLFPINES